jgi:hypothetical protein
MLKIKSEELAKKLDHNDFKATDDWLPRWKCGFGIKFKKPYGEDCADAVSAEKWKYTKPPNLLQKFCADDTFKADETGFYSSTLDGFQRYKPIILLVQR